MLIRNITSGLALLTLSLVLAPARVEAAVTGVVGAGVVSTVDGSTPLDLRKDITQNGLIVGLDERQDLLVGGDTVCVDHLITTADLGVEMTGGPSTALCAAWLPEGLYDTHLLHLDPTTLGQTIISGTSFTFDGEIVGLVTGSVNLTATDGVLGYAPTWIYPTEIIRGMELLDRYVMVVEDAFTITMFSVASGGMDELRVVTVAYDTDGDGLRDRLDGCPLDYDNDIDADGVCGDEDNCETVANADQGDADADGLGDACDDDDDDDGVLDDEDACATTPLGAVVDDRGCAVEDECACEPDLPWRNHGEYVACVAHAATELRMLGQIDEHVRSSLVVMAARSSCGY